MLSDAPQIQRVELVLRERGSDDFCKESKKYSGLKFCFKDGDLTRYSYEPNVFKEATGADLDYIQEKINDCPICKVGLPIKKKPKKLVYGIGSNWTEDLRSYLRNLISELSNEFGVPMPGIVIGKCPPNANGHNTCYDSREKRIYVHPLDAGPHAILHEFAHYKNDILGITDTESGAEAFARAILTSKFDFFDNFPTDLNTSGRYMGYQKQVLSMFEMLDKYYSNLTPYLNVDGKTLNAAWTPEIIAAFVEMAEDNFMPNRFIQFLTETGISLGSIVGPALMPRQFSESDKAVLHNIASHLVMRALKKGLPSELNLLSAQARDFGRAIASFDMDSLFRQFGGGANRIVQDLQLMGTQLSRQVQGFAPFLSVPSGPPATPRVEMSPPSEIPYNLKISTKRTR